LIILVGKLLHASSSWTGCAYPFGRNVRIHVDKSILGIFLLNMANFRISEAGKSEITALSRIGFPNTFCLFWARLGHVPYKVTR
jgi:hypothetical protein